MVVISGDAGEDNHAIGSGDISGPYLLALKDLLRTAPNAARRDLKIQAADLARGYREVLASAPRRKRPYFSLSRTGHAPADPAGRRKEERLAMAWFNAGDLKISGGGPIDLLDYQFPLKAAMADKGIGKIDLLGHCAADGALAVIELKVAGNVEDRRIGLIESLIYAAILEANASAILQQVETAKGLLVSNARPKILLVAPREFWRVGYPSCEALQLLGAQAAHLLQMDIRLLAFDGDAASLGLDGSRPMMAGDILLSPLLADDARKF